jgi:CheY-like chemotaxis protein
MHQHILLQQTKVLPSTPLLKLLANIFDFTIQVDNLATAHGVMMLALLLNKKPMKVLLADDDQDDRDFFKEAIEELKLPVDLEFAVNGMELMSILTSSSDKLPDLIFLDLNMPIKNGQECLEELKSNQKLQHIPVIIYSTSDGREHIDKTYKHGASLYIKKTQFISQSEKNGRESVYA